MASDNESSFNLKRSELYAGFNQDDLATSITEGMQLSSFNI